MDIFSDLQSQLTGIEVTLPSAVFKLILSMILGSVVGLERKRKGQSAGIRTFALISMGATLAMILTMIKSSFLKNNDWYSRLSVGITYEFGRRCETCHYVD